MPFLPPLPKYSINENQQNSVNQKRKYIKIKKKIHDPQHFHFDTRTFGYTS
jgi:uncharacterized membrane protein